MCAQRELYDNAAVMRAEGASILIELPPVEEGEREKFSASWYIETLQDEGSEGLDAVRFRLQGSHDLVTWKTVGSSGSVLWFGNVVHTETPRDVPLGRGERLTLNSGVPLSHWIHFHLFNILFYFGGLMMIVVVMVHLDSWCIPVAKVCVFVQVIECWTMTICFFLEGQGGTYGSGSDHWAYSVYAFGSSIVFLVMLSFFLLLDDCLELLFVVCPMMRSVLTASMYAMLFGTGMDPALGLGTIQWDCGLFALFVVLLGYRIHTVRKALLGMRDSKQKYEQVWQRLCAEHPMEMASLGRAIAAARNTCRLLHRRARHLNRLKGGEAVRRVWKGGEPPVDAAHPSQDFIFRFSLDYSRSMDGRSRSIDSRMSFQSEGALPFRGDDSSRSLRSVGRVAPEPPSVDFGSDETMMTNTSGHVVEEYNEELPSTGEHREHRTCRSSSLRSASSVASVLRHMTSFARKSRRADKDCVASERLSHIAVNVLQSRRLWKIISSHPDGGRGAAVQTLDQLCSQAFMVNDLFFAFVVLLAGRCNGKFRLRSKGETASQKEALFAAWNGGMSDDSRDRFALGGIKNVDACVSKLNMSYHRDVSLLLDMTRETIYFDSIRDMEECLNDLMQNSEVKVVQVKTTMCNVGEEEGPGFESLMFAGFRFIKVNLKLSGNAQAQSLCVESHVCELLLVLTDVARVQTPQDRAAYREWRKFKRAITAWWRLKKWLNLTPVRHFSQHYDFFRSSASRRGTRVSSLPESCHRDSHASSSVGAENVRSGSEERNLTVGEEEPAAHPPTPAPVRAGSRKLLPVAEPVDMQVRSEGQGGTGECEDSVEGEKDEAMMFDARGNRAFTGGETSWGMKMDGKMEELLEGLCRMAGLGVSDFLDRKWKLVQTGSSIVESSSSHSSLYFAIHPITAVLQRKSLQLCLFLVAIYFLVLGIRCTQYLVFSSGEYAFGPFQHYRFETMLTRDGSEGTGIAGPGIADFGIIGPSRCSFRGSPLSPVGSNQVEPSTEPLFQNTSFSGAVGTSFVVSYLEPAKMTGWYVDTIPFKEGGEDGEEDGGDGEEEVAWEKWQGQQPTYFNVWATNEMYDVSDESCARGRQDARWWEGAEEVEWCGVSWMRVGTPLWRYSAGLFKPPSRVTPGFCDFVQVEVELSSVAREEFLLSPSYGQFMWTLVVPPMAGGMCFSLAVIFTRLRHRFPFLPYGNVVLAAGMGLVSLSNSMAILNGLSLNQLHLALENASRALPSMILCVAFAWDSTWFAYGLLAYCVTNLGLWCSMCQWLYHDPFANLPSSGIAALCLCVPIFFTRFYTLRSAKKSLRDDQMRYDALWVSLCNNEDGMAGIQHLRKVVEMIGLDKDNYCRQLNRSRGDQLSSRVKEKYTNQAMRAGNRMHPLFWDIGHWYHSLLTPPPFSIPHSSMHAHQLLRYTPILIVALCRKLRVSCLAVYQP